MSATDYCQAECCSPRCPVCGSRIDYCQGHGMTGDPEGYVTFRLHDEGFHYRCDEASQVCDEGPSQRWDSETDVMTLAQAEALIRLTMAYGVGFDATTFHPQFDLPPGYVAGWIGTSIYVGVDADGRVSS